MPSHGVILIMADPETLYKLMILYMLKKVNFPLSNPQLWSFFHDRDYTSFFVFQNTVDALLDANLVKQDEVRSVTRYELTKEGEDALYYFKNDIPEDILSEMNAFLKENQFQLRNETGIVSDYKKTENYDYRVHCEVREGKSILFDINLTVPTEDQAKILCEHFEENAQIIYAYVMKRLM